MSSDRTLTLLDVATRVAERLRTDPRIANFIDPAVCIAAHEEGCDATLVERLELTKIMAEIRSDPADPAETATVGSTVGVLIVDKKGASFYMLPDPRVYPGLWPWTLNGDHRS
jgi:hypothetical protein